MTVGRIHVLDHHVAALPRDEPQITSQREPCVVACGLAAAAASTSREPRDPALLQQDRAELVHELDLR